MEAMHEETNYDIYDIWYTPIWKTSLFLLVTCTIIVIIISLVAYLLYKKYRKRKRTLKPWEIALYKLHAIKLDQFEDRKEFYFELTYLLKIYLSERYNLDLEGKTDQELIETIQKNKFPKDLLERLEKIFIGAVTIKFAHEDVVLMTMEQDLKRGIEIVRNTIPKN